MSLSQNIRKYRLLKGYTQDTLAALLGLSSQAVSKWETSETYPDGALLVPLSNALEVSLDALFDNETASMKEVTGEIMRLFESSEDENEFTLARELCWQIEKALFNRRVKINTDYDPDELSGRHLSSYVLGNSGFTCVSNGRAPFFSVFPEYDGNYSEVIGDGEKMRKIFAALSSPETVRAVLFIHRNKRNYVFEKEHLAEVCGIAEDKLDNVIADLISLNLVYADEIEMNGGHTTLYFSAPSHVMIALFLFAHEINYRDGYCCQSERRDDPLLR